MLLQGPPGFGFAPPHLRRYALRGGFLRFGRTKPNLSAKSRRASRA